jgi:aryl-alcohol dehydrogenase-like predicted oxidoreductase
VLEDIRERVWVNTKTIDRTYDGAMRQMEISFKRLKTDYVDLMFVHSVDNEEHYRQIMAPNSVLKAVEEMKTAGRVRHIGVSGHWVRDVQARIIQDFPFEAVLHPAGLFNVAYDYSFLDVVTPVARERGMAVLGMKILGSGRVKRARSIEPYLRYSFSLPIDTAVIGVDSIHQLEEIVRVAKRPLTPVDEREQRSLIPEALEITREWDEGEFNWLQAYSAELRS